jgi:phosphatidylserine decarboxylase
MKDASIPDEYHVHRTGGWLPQDHRAHQEGLRDLIENADKNKAELAPVLKSFQEAIESDTRLYLLFTQMFDQIPKKKQYKKDPSGQKQVRSYHHMLRVLNHILTTPPSWITQAEKSHVVGLPINALLDWPMGTSAGFAAFLDPTVNKYIKEIVDAWGEFLKSPASASCLGTDEKGWFGPTALKRLEETANLGGQTSHKFEALFHCDPSKEHHGVSIHCCQSALPAFRISTGFQQ